MRKKPNKPFNFNSGPKFNPGIKSDRGRLITIIVAIGIVYWLYNLAQDIFSEVFPPEPEATIVEETSPTNEPTSGIDIEPIAEPSPETGIGVFNSTAINSDLPDKETMEILKRTRKDVIRQLEEQGQHDQIEIFEEALQEFEDSL